MSSEYFTYCETKRTDSSLRLALFGLSFAPTQLMRCLSALFARARAVESVDMFVAVSAAGVSMAALERDQTRFETIL